MIQIQWLPIDSEKGLYGWKRECVSGSVLLSAHQKRVYDSSCACVCAQIGAKQQRAEPLLPNYLVREDTLDKMSKREIRNFGGLSSHFLLSSFLPSCLSIQLRPFPPSKSVSLASPSAPSACRRDEVMHHRRSAEPSPLAVPSPCPPLGHKHMGESLCQRPTQNTWLRLVTRGGQCSHTYAHTSRQGGHTYAHWKTHTANLAWRASPWLSHSEPHHQLWVNCGLHIMLLSRIDSCKDCGTNMLRL